MCLNYPAHSTNISPNIFYDYIVEEWLDTVYEWKTSQKESQFIISKNAGGSGNLIYKNSVELRNCTAFFWYDLELQITLEMSWKKKAK